jgi:KUP system potassium uptake protein
MAQQEGVSDAVQTTHQHAPAGTAALALSAIGVVYGDIGTSPIYALRETVRAAAGEAVPTESEVIGALSIIMWAITLVVTLKYAIFVLRADNKGEGGTLSIMTLAKSVANGWKPTVIVFGMIGAALFYGDAVITPAISVLSAVEGLKVAAPAVATFVVPITVTILIALFAVQKYGTAAVSSVFGPITLLWFLTLGFIGAVHILDDPTVFRAINPYEAVRFVIDHSAVALAVVGASFLAVTGAEALYVDLGHFGKRPILYAWFFVVFPCLIINYLGQGAYLLHTGGPVGQPLFQMVPSWATIPLVVLATMATVIASQAVITGAYSLTRQAIQLHLLPRLDIVHTSATQSGQIYLPQVNWILLIGVLALVIGFGSSEHMAAAYGISVSGEMLMTTLLLFVVMRGLWKWSAGLALAVAVPFLVIDTLFLTANATKLVQGGWVSVALAVGLLLVMFTWTKGSAILFEKTRKAEVPLDTLVRSLEAKPPHIVDGTAVFLTSDPESAPTSLLHSLKHYKVLHKQNVILSVDTLPQPRVSEKDRVRMDDISEHFTRLSLRYGFMEDPHIPSALAACRKQGLKFDIMSTSFFLSRRSLIPSKHSGMPVWQDRIFIALAKNAVDATTYFRLPTGRVVEIGTQVVV